MLQQLIDGLKIPELIAWENAVEIAKILKCHPVDLYQPRKQIKLRCYIGSDFEVKKFSEMNKKDIYVPYEYYHPNIKLVLIIQYTWIMD